MAKGTPAMGKHSGKKTHIMCRRCGGHSFHARNKVCAKCGFGKTSRFRVFSWLKK